MVVAVPRRLPGGMVMVIMPVIVRMGMIVMMGVGMPVRMAMFVMVVPGCCHDGLENFIGLLERYVVALQHLTYGKVVLDKQIIVGELSGEM